MKVLNYGSLNIDYVYEVDHFVKKGETLLSRNLKRFCGGKGLNQSVALKRAGLSVYHAGMIGEDGLFLKEFLEKENINTNFLKVSKDIPTGNAIIQNDISGDNSIILYGGANQNINLSDVENTLQNFDKNDYIVLQNEINNIGNIIEIAHNRGMKILFNPAPINENINKINFEYIDILILNEIEASFFLKNKEITCDNLKELRKIFPNAEIIVTLGEKGSIYFYKNTIIRQNAFKVEAIDSTGAGDTFIGYFLACKLKQESIKTSFEIASKASAISVTRIGASVSIPTMDEVSKLKSK